MRSPPEIALLNRNAIAKNTIAAFVMVIATVQPASDAAAQAHRDYFGVGGDSCGRWMDARKAGDTSRHGSWLLGYLSALNLWGVIGGKDALAGSDADGLYAWMDGYCQAHPLDSIAVGAGDLARELDKRAR